MADNLESKLSRIISCAENCSNDATQRSLLHAYIACLSFSELCDAIVQLIESDKVIRLALRSRLLRILREDTEPGNSESLAELVERTRQTAVGKSRTRNAVDALHSALFVYLPLPTKQTVLDDWMGRGTRSGAARWLKATGEVPELFNAPAAFTYWKATGDYKAARSLANEAEPKFLDKILREFVEKCEEGWVISKAVLRLTTVDDTIWAAVREKHPATYAYLCAKVGRFIDDEDAYRLVCECSGFSGDHSRGLAIWAVGQLGLIDVLDRIADVAPELEARDRDEFLNKYMKET